MSDFPGQVICPRLSPVKIWGAGNKNRSRLESWQNSISRDVCCVTFQRNERKSLDFLSWVCIICGGNNILGVLILEKMKEKTSEPPRCIYLQNVRYF